MTPQEVGALLRRRPHAGFRTATSSAWARSWASPRAGSAPDRSLGC